MTTPEEILEILKETRKLIGSETKPVKAKYPVEYEPIRRWCHMADNANPLFLDPEYAKKTKYGEVICPPGAVQVFAVQLFTRRRMPQEAQPSEPSGAEEERLPAIPMPEGMAIGFNLGNEWEFLKPVKVGERLSVKRRIGDVYIKEIRYDPQTFWTISETVYLNEAGEEVVISRSPTVYFRRAEQLKKDGVTGYPR